MVLLALGAVMSLSGISSCKKNQPIGRSDIEMSSFAVDSEQNFPARHHTPIPSTLLLLGSGVAGMAFWGWRRRAKS